MGKYFLEDEKVRVNFDDGEWVDIKEELTQADQDYILNQMTFAEQGNNGTKMEIKLGQLSLLERSIVDWSFLETNGNKIPINSDNISRLRKRYRNKILQEINNLNEKAESFASKN